MNRTEYIGSSDARDILSGDWDRVYRKKKGIDPEPDLSDSFAVQMGLLTEDFHLGWTFKRMREADGNGWQFSKKPPKGDQHFSTYQPDGSAAILGSHPDALTKNPATASVYPVEAKLTGRWKNANEAADYFMPQLQHHMICWDTDLLLFSVVVGTNEPERIWVGYSPEWASHYIDRCKAFWDKHIVAGIQPAPQLLDQAKQAKPIVPTKVADSVPLNGWKRRSLDGDNRAPLLIDKYVETKEAVREHDEAKASLKALMRDDENELYSDRLVLKRDKRGAIRFTLREPETA